MRKQKNNTIEEITAIIRGDQPKRQKKMRGAMVGLLNQGGLGAVCSQRGSGQFCKLIPAIDIPYSMMNGNGCARR